MDFKEQYHDYVITIDQYLDDVLKPQKDRPEQVIFEAMRYSLLAKGKRIRPVLALAVCDLFSLSKNEVLPFAAAIEMIHSYSLIHDDLPAMDNDDLRRGMPTNHKVYGEAVAILAGDGLLNFAFEHMSMALATRERLEEKIKAFQLISKASGVFGMISGQVIDMISENKAIDGDVLERMHQLKTGALISAPILAAATICRASEDEWQALLKFSANLGLAFQIKDDILDVEGTKEMLGKNVGMDQNQQKSTFISIYGLNQSKEMLEKTTNEAILALDCFGEKSTFLVSVANFLLKREY
jgi:geranylgeranyl diphosphate synthase, type II